MFAPTGTSAAVVARLNAAVRQAVRGADVAERLAVPGGEPLDEPRDAMGTVIRADAERWVEVFRQAGARSI
jgi:tripartite-type tricarboxylate transporter receptor subunit TctC